MHHLPTPRSWTARPAFAITLLLCLGLHSPARAAKLVVYLETPSNPSARTTLEIASLRLVAQDHQAQLSPRFSELTPSELAGQARRWVETSVAAGRYDALEIEIAKVEGFAGVAPVNPSPPGEALRIPIGLTIAEDEGVLLRLRWSPRHVDPEKETHVPSFEILPNSVPPLGSLAFVSNEGSNYLSVISTASHEIVAILPVGDGPRGLVHARRLNRLYVALAASDEVAAFESSSLRPVRSMPVQFGDEPSRLALSDDEELLFVLNRGSDVLSTLTTDGLSEIHRYPLGQRVHALAVDPVTGFVYVSSSLSSEILVYDPAGQALVSSITVDSDPTELLIDGRSRQLFVGSGMLRRLTVIDLDRGAETDRLDLCSPADGLAYDPNSRRLYCSIGACRQISILRPDRDLELGAIKTTRRGGLLSFDAQGRKLLVVLPEDGELTIFNASSRNRLATLEVGERPHSVVVP